MIPDFCYSHPCLTVIAAAFLVNIPMGYIRQGHSKFSAKWFFWIHASIPLIIYLRLSLHLTPALIPVFIFFAVLGQILGSRFRSRRMTDAEWKRLHQIPDTRRKNQPKRFLPETEVMVVLMNMGGPKSNADVKDFLLKLFNDSLLIRFPLSALLQPFFSWLIVTLRWKAAAERYQLIGGGSPIFESTRNQAEALAQELRRRGREIDVIFSFNYSQPLPNETLMQVKAAGKKYLLPLSLYPHYSKATTGSNIHYLSMAARQFHPDVEFLDTPEYFLHPGYIQAFVERIQGALKPSELLDDFYLLFSAHGLPLYFLTEGDPYPFQVAQTAGCVLNKLGRTKEWSLSYQSAVGPLQWLKPSTENMIHTLAKQGIKKLLVVPISFVTDHIETLCEIDIEYRKVAEDAGITDFRMSRALECHPGFIQALADSVETALPRELSSRQEKVRPGRIDIDSAKV
ncbi:MAG: ferrochelatase [Candidatus Omnitrophota bacterium]|nr:ferrochelatase [Candidatus Omnitrophota bacterium]MDZ4243331.1 ferrochelatase [Candidatus Omnitrophota bacterium]